MKSQKSVVSFWNIRMAVAFLIVGIGITIIASIYAWQNSEAFLKSEYASVCNEIRMKIDTRLHAHAQLLRAGSAFIETSDSVTRKEWGEFIKQAKIERNLPGIQGVGFSLIVPKNQLEKHVQSIRNEGFPDYAVKPLGDRALYTSIVYLEPFSGMNLRAFGYDMFSEIVRRKAMEQSCDSDSAMLSGKVKLVQEINGDVQPGTLMYVPVYRAGSLANTVQQRRAAIMGWVYSPYRMNDLMQGILGHWDLLQKQRIHLQVYDDTISVSSLLYDSQANDTLKSIDLASRSLTVPVVFNGKKWVLFFTQSKDQLLFSGNNAVIVLIGGLAISLLLFGLLLSLINTKARALQIAAKLTSELKESENRFSLFMDYLPVIVFLKDSKGKALYVNKFMENVLGASTWLGKDMLEIFPNEFGKKYLADDLRVMKQGYEKISESVMLSDGIWHDFETQKFAIPRQGEEPFLGGIALDLTERNQAEENHRRLFETMSQGVIYYDGKGEIVSANPAAERILGLMGDDLKRKNIINSKWGMIREDGSVLPDSEHPFPMALSTGKPVKDFVMGLVNPKNNELLWLSLTLIPIFKTGEIKPYLFYSTFEDITMRKNNDFLLKQKTDKIEALNEEYQHINEELVRLNAVLQKSIEKAGESEAQFRDVLDNSIVASYKRNLGTNNYEYISPVFASITGFTPEEMKDLTLDAVLDLVHPDDLDEIKRLIANLLNGTDDKSFNIDYRFKHKIDGCYRWLFDQFTVIRDVQGNPTAIIGSISDITVRKKTEEDLRIATESLYEAQEIGNIGSLSFDLVGQTLTVSPQMGKIFGMAPGEVWDDKVWRKRLHPYDSEAMESYVADCLERGIPYDRDYRIIRDGQLRWLRGIAKAETDTNGKVVRISVINIDITAHKQSEAKIKLQNEELLQLIATKDKFFSIIAHDLKSPFNAIIGFSDLLVEQVKENDYDGIDKYAGIILQSSKRAMDLLTNLMEWSRSQTGRMDYNPEYFEMVALINDITLLFDDIAGQKSITIQKELPSKAVAFADKAMISTVFRNLVSNAIKFTHPGGKVTLSILQEPTGTMVSVRDSGVGIPRNRIGKLFSIDQSFSTVGTKNEMGTGLGLILCKEFVEKHGGKIWVESKEGIGSVFYFTLPSIKYTNES